jgi:hypothetical protein
MGIKKQSNPAQAEEAKRLFLSASHTIKLHTATIVCQLNDFGLDGQSD